MSNEKPTDEQIARDAAISMCPISKPDGLREKWLYEAESIILSAIHKANKRVTENVLPLVADLVKADIDDRVEKGIEITKEQSEKICGRKLD